MAVLPVPEIVQKMAVQIEEMSKKFGKLAKQLDQISTRVEALEQTSQDRKIKLDDIHSSITVCKDMLRTLNRKQDGKEIPG